uniref:Na_H_Exchanger domain-containing protein n=2 Tax=Hymenolepis diminuta TaxID=6216 RepID=A0A158QEL2_HYMDI
LSKALHCELNFFNEFVFFGVLYPPLAINAALQFKQIFRYGILPATVVFGLFGSFFNFILTALSLWLVHEFGFMEMKNHNVKPIAFAVFSSLICSTDLAIVFGLLGKLKVHPFLYLLFVGESLVNDGVSLSLFAMTNNAANSHIECVEKFGVLPWLCLVLLCFSLQLMFSTIIGFIFGCISSIVTRWTTHETALEPVIVFCLCYTGYIITYICSWPTTFYLIIFCTILSSFTFRNISHKSVITIQHFAQMTGTVADSLIFLYVGFSIATHEIVWHTEFIVWTTLFSIFWRFVFIFMASFLTNYFLWTRQKISLGMMFFISYGGFKGSVAHALVEIISPQTALAMGIPLSILRCTVVFINLFYVLFIGLTMAPLLRIYKFLSSETGKLSLFETLNDRVIQSACNAIADVVGHGHGVMRTAFVKFYKRYLRPLLLHDPHQHDEITDVYADIALALHHASVAKDRHSVHFHLRRLRPQLKKAFYYQQQNSFPHNKTSLLLKPFHNIHLHHIDLISNSGLDASHQHYHSTETPEDEVISDSSREVFYDIESNGFSQDENWEAFHSLKTVPKRRKKACCGFDLESSESDTFSLDDIAADHLKPSSSSSERRRQDEDESLFRELLLRQNQHTYTFDECAFAEQVQASIQSKHRALKFHHL